MVEMQTSRDSNETKEEKVQISDFCQKLHAAMSARSNLDDQVATCAKALSSTFRVQPYEVACFKFDSDQESFSFLWPPELRESGSIPFSARRSLLVRTAEERKAFLDNSFASTPHLFVFEGFSKINSAPIQRIMSVPILRGEELLGVLQLCRRGATGDGLPMFSNAELVALVEIAKVVATFL
jgi:transcriptional regulator with GAF, ATPase, and Fis domain